MNFAPATPGRSAQDCRRLLRLLPGPDADFSAWGTAFGGIALHEYR